MSLSFAWACEKRVDADQWRHFCVVMSDLLNNCPAIPLADQQGIRINAVSAFERRRPEGAGDALPVALHIKGADEEGGAPCTLRFDDLSGQFGSDGPSGHLVHAAMLVAAATIKGFTFIAEFTNEREAGFGLALARNALARTFTGLGVASIERFLESFKGIQECRAMDARAATYGALREQVRGLIASVDGQEPEGAFEEATLRTAQAVLQRLELGIDDKFDAEYAVHSLQGYFNQSKFFEPAALADGPSFGM